MFLLNHISCCLWFLIAKLDDMNPDTWVARQHLVDENVLVIYVQAFYWSFQTLSTVGFGDINAKTTQERIYAMIWMIVGICFYSYMIGNMTNLIASMDSSSEELITKLSILKEFKKRTKMNNRLFLKIKRHLENNSKAVNNFILQDKLLNDLPLSLRSQVIACTHGEIIERVYFFKEKNQDFLMSIMIELRPLRLQTGDVIYHNKDHGEEIYFISEGKVKLHIDVGPMLFDLKLQHKQHHEKGESREGQQKDDEGSNDGDEERN